MVLQDLGRRLTAAISSVSGHSALDEQALDAVLKSVSAALLESDVNVALVKRTRDRVKKQVLPQLEELQAKSASANQDHDPLAGNKAKQLIHKAIFDELVTLVDPGDAAPPAFNPVKGKSQVIMMVGLQGAGKTTTCTKLATHYQRRGLKVALVCADTFRAGAFDQLKQNATRAKVPFFGSYTETDPVSISLQGVQKFRAERFDVIIVDTSGRHRQETELFHEMEQIQDAVEPDMTVLVLDGAIGQAAEAQSRAFKEASNFGAIIVTKLDGHAKGGGAISAVAATSTPIIFLGVGEHLHDLEKFSPRPFVSKLLGMGDMQGLVERAQEMALADPARQENMIKKLEKGEFTVRDLKDQLQTVMN
ncbi:RNA-binding signal recognition particle subunit SRP54, partial [Rhodotorula paludigena]|uniref:RNA-binding signal recognition particle subunit SRP54 n=1 Tax=Rhodotorula paludigena TaxID=86838 RepID=UPI00316BDB5A